MKKIRRTLTMVLVGITALCGCVGETKEKDETGNQDTVLHWALVGLDQFGELEISEEAQEDFNQILKDNGKDYQIQFHKISFEDGVLSEEDEQFVRSCDLITMQHQVKFSPVTIYPVIQEHIEKGTFASLDSLAQSEVLQEHVMTSHYFDMGNEDGTQYVLATTLSSVQGTTVQIEKDLYEAIEGEKEVVPDFTECDEFFERVYKANGNQPFLVLSNQLVKNGINGVVNTYPKFLNTLFDTHKFIAEGVGVGALRTKSDDMKSHSLLHTEYAREYMQAWRRYYEKGYVSTEVTKTPLVDVSFSNELKIRNHNDGTADWVMPMSNQYCLEISNAAAYGDEVVGIGVDSQNQELALKALEDLIVDSVLNEAVRELYGENIVRFVLHIEQTEEELERYKAVVDTLPIFEYKTTNNEFYVPEMDALNEVYASYVSDEKNVDVLQLYFSKDGQVTEESVQEGLQAIRDKVDEAGIEKVVKAYEEQKLEWYKSTNDKN